MESIILIKFLEIKFHNKYEYDTKEQVIECYNKGQYTASAIMICALFEMIILTRFIRETMTKEMPVRTKENLKEQIDKLRDVENRITNIDKPRFNKILESLIEFRVIQGYEKESYIDLYSIRNMVMHGLHSRLYEYLFRKMPANTFILDIEYNNMCKQVTEIFIKKIVKMSDNGVILKIS